MKKSNKLITFIFGMAVSIALPSLASPSPNGAYSASEVPITLDVHFHTKKYVYDNQWPVELEVARLTNVHLNNIASMATIKSQQALILLLATGELPPIVAGSEIKHNVNLYGPEGAFIPLNDLIDKYAPHIKAFFENNPDIRSSLLAEDGNIYYIPYLPDGDLGRGYVIRYDWLNNLKLDVPQNVDELYNVLIAFRDNDPNGNGKKDEVPIFMRDWQELIRLVTLWDGRSTGSDKYHDFYLKDGNIQHGYVQEGYHEGIRHLSKWYKEGLIDREVFTRGERTREYFLANNIGGMTHDWITSTASYNDTLRESIPNFEFKAMLPPSSTSGKRIEEHRRAKVKDSGWAMSFTNKNSVETIKYFDFFFTEEGRRIANYGVEGKQYEMIDGKPVFKNEIIENKSPITLQMKEIGAQIPRGFHQDLNYELQRPNKHVLEAIALYDTDNYFVEPFLGVSLNKNEKKVYDKFWPSILGYMLENQQAWILGYRDVDKEWDGYITKLNKMGYKEVIQIMQSAYDRAYKR